MLFKILALALAASLWTMAEEPRLVTFPSGDGGLVEADQYEGSGPAVVLAHGGRFTKESWAEQAPILQQHGFKVLAINFRGRGQSRGGPDSEDGQGYHHDVLAAVHYLRSAGAEEVFVIGASFGGWASAAASATQPGAIDRLVLLAAPADDPEKLTGRKLFILTREDFQGSGTLRLPAIQAQFERAPEPKKLVVLRGSAHAQFIFRTDQAGRLMEEILSFLQEP